MSACPYQAGTAKFIKRKQLSAKVKFREIKVLYGILNRPANIIIIPCTCTRGKVSVYPSVVDNRKLGYRTSYEWHKFNKKSV